MNSYSHDTLKTLIINVGYRVSEINTVQKYNIKIDINSEYQKLKVVSNYLFDENYTEKLIRNLKSNKKYSSAIEELEMYILLGYSNYQGLYFLGYYLAVLRIISQLGDSTVKDAGINIFEKIFKWSDKFDKYDKINLEKLRVIWGKFVPKKMTKFNKKFDEYKNSYLIMKNLPRRDPNMCYVVNKKQQKSKNQKTRLFGMIKTEGKIILERAEEYLGMSMEEIRGLIYDMVGEGKIEGKFQKNEFIITSGINNFVDLLDSSFDLWEKNSKKNKN
ncbi:MAG: hypothetical protein ACTSRK_02075 [Promethearchaeota archaeon]